MTYTGGQTRPLASQAQTALLAAASPGTEVTSKPKDRLVQLQDKYSNLGEMNHMSFSHTFFVMKKLKIE